MSESSTSKGSLRVFVQAEGMEKIHVVEVPSDTDIMGLLSKAREGGIEVPDNLLVVLEDRDEAITHDVSLSDAGVTNNASVHLASCKRVDVDVRYAGATQGNDFSPAQRLRHVFDWAVGKRAFEIPEGDAQDLVLILTGEQQPLNLDDHVGRFVSGPGCETGFDLVPRDRIQG